MKTGYKDSMFCIVWNINFLLLTALLAGTLVGRMYRFFAIQPTNTVVSVSYVAQKLFDMHSPELFLKYRF